MLMFGVIAIQKDGKRNYYWPEGQCFQNRSGKRNFRIETIWWRRGDCIGYGVSEYIGHEKQKENWILLDKFNHLVMDNKLIPIEGAIQDEYNQRDQV